VSLVVDRRVEAELTEQRALLVPARGADDATSCPAIEPVAPAAPEISTVSPSRSAPTRNRPKYAVSPVVPNVPTVVRSGVSGGNVCIGLDGPAIAYSCHPVIP
jgi:hypothetical protein